MKTRIKTAVVVLTLMIAVSAFGQRPRAVLIKPVRPDTLWFGDFAVKVIQYDSIGKESALSGTYTGLHGVGRLLIDCSLNPKKPVFWPFDEVFQANLTIVRQVQNPVSEIDVDQARRLNLPTAIGRKISVDLPRRATERGWAIADLYDISEQLKGKTPGLEIVFSGVAATKLPNGVSARVTAGTGVFRPRPAYTQASLQLGQFRLDIDVFSVTGIGLRVGHSLLYLPPSISSGKSCQAASLELSNYRLDRQCRFYAERLTDEYGTFYIGQTGLKAKGKGFIADFSDAQSFAPRPPAWKGIVFLNGASASTAVDIISNTGYSQADYQYNTAEVTDAGWASSFDCDTPFQYTTLQPYDFKLVFAKAHLTVLNSRINGGDLLGGKISAPAKAVRTSDNNEAVFAFDHLAVESDMDVAGPVVPLFDSLMVGDWWNRTTPVKAYAFAGLGEPTAYFSARHRPAYYPLSAGSWNRPNLSNPIGVNLQANGIQGITFRDFALVQILTPDKPKDSPPVVFKLLQNTWLTITGKGVHGEWWAFRPVEPRKTSLGPTADARYQGGQALDIAFETTNSDYALNQKPVAYMRFVESAVYEADFNGNVTLPLPAGNTFGFAKMVFTSTAHNAGGQVVLNAQDSLKYWGLQLVAKPGVSSAGLLSVKTGQLIFTAAGLSEKRHFARPFNLTWGELLANGNTGRLFFDFREPDQAFDGFGLSTHAVRLSTYKPLTNPFGYLEIGGFVHLPLFGTHYQHIIDKYEPATTAMPFQQRRVELSTVSDAIFRETTKLVAYNWQDGLSAFNYTLSYNDALQSGFLGAGNALVRFLTGGVLASTITIARTGTCLSFGAGGPTYRGIALGPVANVSTLTAFWGCGCVENDQLKRLTIGGELGTAGNFNILARAGSTVSAVMTITPDYTRLALDGLAYVSLAQSVDVEVSGHFGLLLNYAQNYVEGEISGDFRFAQGAILVGNSLEAKGEANWHISAGLPPANYQSIQGALSVSTMGFTSTQLGAGFYLGINAPKDKAWVLAGADPRYRFNMAALPGNLTGVYGFVKLQKGINLYVISGDYEVFAGLGVFLLDPAQAIDLNARPSGFLATTYVLGNLGGRIHGEILGGLVSAGAYFDLQLVGPVPFGFQGTVGLEACVLWVACGSVDLTIGLNQNDGFYIR